MVSEREIPHYCCYKCRNIICQHNDIVSKQFIVLGARAYLFSHAKNVVMEEPVSRRLDTGIYTVADAHCNECKQLLGWKYITAEDDMNKYKEGMFVIEKFKLDLEATKHLFK